MMDFHFTKVGVGVFLFVSSFFVVGFLFVCLTFTVCQAVLGGKLKSK